MKTKIVLMAVLLGILVGKADAEPSYVWPLKLKPELTSKFCDYRAGHFHAGIDLRTQGKTGFRVYASDNGYIFRVSTSFRGYGKAVYLKLRDGNIAVFGHLSAFTEPVEERVFDRQLKSRKYAQDIYLEPGEYPVGKGDIIGFSGDTGSGAPHLHYEMRSPDNNPMNPLLFGLDIDDSSLPEFHFLAVKYFSRDYLPDGSIDDYDQMELIKASALGKREYKIRDTIICDQQIALAVSGGDLISGPGFLYGFYGLKLLVDDSLIFEMRSDSLSYASTRQLNYIRDLELIRLFGAKQNADNDANIFYRLYVPPLSHQFFWPGYEVYSGAIESSEEKGRVREVRVMASDEAGNETALRFHIREPELAFVASDEARCIRQGDKIYFVINSPIRPVSNILEYRNSEIGEYQPLASTLSASLTVREERDCYIDSVMAVIAIGERTYRLRYLDSVGHSSTWIYFRESDISRKLTIGGSPDLLKLEYRSPEQGMNLEAHIRSDSLEEVKDMRSSGPGLYIAEIGGQNISGSIWIGIEHSDSLIFDTTITLYPVRPKHAGYAYSPDSTLQIFFDESSAYTTAYVSASDADHLSTSSGIRIIYDIRPADMVVDNPIRFKFDMERLGLAGRKVGVYGSSGDGDGWSFIAAASGGKLEANGIGLGKLAILEDNQPPAIRSISPAKSTSSRTPLLSCIISDNLSGLALDQGLSMSIDSQWVPAQFDIDSGRFFYRIRNPLKRGKHKLEIAASDNQGNSVTETMFFSVVGKK